MNFIRQHVTSLPHSLLIMAVTLMLPLCLWAKKTPQPERRTFQVGNVSFTMIHVEGGSFAMGGTPEQRSEPMSLERPVHRVILSDYWIAETEVTRRLWKAVMGAAPKDGGNDWLADDMPQEWVSWTDCCRFIHTLDSITGLTFRMPSEAEWEYAARGGRKPSRTRYAGDNDATLVGWVYSNSGSRTHTVAQKQPNGLGIYDMTGNVWEWCGDFFSLYADTLQVNPQGPATGTRRVVRGGSWDNAADNVRLSARQGREQDYTFYDCGMRLAMSDTTAQDPAVPVILPEQRTVKVAGHRLRFRLVTPAADSLVTAPYYIAETEVPQALWRSVMHANPSARRGIGRPVEGVSWNDCCLFLAELNNLSSCHFRLPTDAEWEYAARGGQNSLRYRPLLTAADSAAIRAARPKQSTHAERKARKNTNAFLGMLVGNEHLLKDKEDATLFDYTAYLTDSVGQLYAGGNISDKVAWTAVNSKGRPHRVAAKQPNELNLYDMSGNVAEWTADRTVRGGSWMDAEERCRLSTAAQSLSPAVSTPYIGLRLVLLP